MTTEQIGTRLIHEDEECRVWLLELEPGEASDWHVHECDYVFVVTQAGRVCTELVEGGAEIQDDSVGDSRYHTADSGHRLVNLSNSRYRNVIVELKGVRRDC